MAQCVLKGASACGKRWQLVFHCAETDAAHAAHACAELPPGRRAPRAVDTHSLNRDRFRVRTRTAVRDYLLSDNLVDMPPVERPTGLILDMLPLRRSAFWTHHASTSKHIDLKAYQRAPSSPEARAPGTATVARREAGESYEREGERGAARKMARCH